MVSRTQDPTAPRVDTPAGDGDRQDEPVTDDQTPSAAFKAAQRRLEELKEYVSYYISAKTDSVKVSVRNAVMYAVLGIVALLAAATLVITAVVLLCYGIAGALAALFGGALWQGYLVAGLLLLTVVGGVAWFALRKITNASREGTVKKYAARQQQQRAQFGEDVQQAARDPSE